jgi:hypothetical protein
MGENVFIFLIDLVHISELSLKVYVHVQVISLTTGRLVPGVAGAIERTTYLNRIFS